MVQLYAGCVKSAYDRPARELKGFRKLLLQPGVLLLVDPATHVVAPEGPEDQIAPRLLGEVRADHRRHLGLVAGDHGARVGARTVTCPSCGSANHGRYRSPKLIAGALLRRHRCNNCERIFLSAEVVVESLDHLEKMTQVTAAAAKERVADQLAERLDVSPRTVRKWQRQVQ